MSARSFSFGPSSDWGAEAASRMVPAYSQLSPKPSVARYATTDVALCATAGLGLACGGPQKIMIDMTSVPSAKGWCIRWVL